MSILKNKKIVLGITGSIAAYKALNIARSLILAGADVSVVMSRGAIHFISPITFQAVTHHPVITDLFNPQGQTGLDHISMAKQADVLLIAPTTANVLAKMAHGLGDDALTTIFLATTSPIIVAPAMETAMWQHPATQRNIQILASWGVTIINPETGPLASGAQGTGRLAGAKTIVETTRCVLGQDGPLNGKNVLITTGPTREHIDPIRFLSNSSSGTMGFTLAQEARDRGARVTLITGPTALSKPAGITVVPIVSAHEMHTEVFNYIEQTDVLVATAAVTDYRPKRISHTKIKKTSETLLIAMTKNPDIVGEVANWKEKHPKKKLLMVGFAAETDDVIRNAQQKLKKKKLDLIIANTAPNSFGTDTTQAAILHKNKRPEKLFLTTKTMLAEKIMDIIVSELNIS